MVTASITFTQSAVSPGPGISMVGVGGAVVTLTNADDTGVVDWAWELLDSPLNSALVPGAIGTAASETFTPDIPDTPGCYRIKLTTQGADGSVACDVKNFAVPTTQGWILPPFRATAAELNFPGNTEGWESLLNQIFLTIPSGGGGVGGQLLWGDDSIGLSTTPRFLSPGYDDGQAEAVPAEIRLSRAGTLRNMRIRHSIAGVGAANLTYTLLINGIATTLAAILPANTQDGGNLINSVAVAASALATLRVEKAGVITQSPNGVAVTMEYA